MKLLFLFLLHQLTMPFKAKRIPTLRFLRHCCETSWLTQARLAHSPLPLCQSGLNNTTGRDTCLRGLVSLFCCQIFKLHLQLCHESGKNQRWVVCIYKYLAAVYYCTHSWTHVWRHQPPPFAYPHLLDILLSIPPHLNPLYVLLSTTLARVVQLVDFTL